MQQFEAPPARGNGTYAEFFVSAVQNNFKSSQEGRPIFEDREFVRIIIPGDNKTEMVYEATDVHRERYERQYDAFKRSEDQRRSVGTPLKQWPMMTPALVRTLEAANVYTVEQLAEVTDTQMQHIGLGAREWREKAKGFLKQAKDGAAVQKYVAENDTLKKENIRLQSVIDGQAEEIKALKATKSKDAA